MSASDTMIVRKDGRSRPFLRADGDIVPYGWRKRERYYILYMYPCGRSPTKTPPRVDISGQDRYNTMMDRNL